MQAMQPYFDVDFHYYAVDRAALSTSRTRAQLMSVFERKLRQATLDALCRDVAMGSDEKEKRPEHPTLDAKGNCKCPCGSRHYKNDDASWERHITYKKHRCLFALFVVALCLIMCCAGIGETCREALLLKLRWRRVLFALRTSTNGSTSRESACCGSGLSLCS